MSTTPPGAAGGRVQTPPPIILPPRGETSQAARGCSKWMGVGCGAAIIVLAALILGSFLFLDRGVQWAVRRAADRIEERMDPGVSPALRDRLHSELDALSSRSGETGSAPRNGAFLQRAGKALEDGRITPEEAKELEAFLTSNGAGGNPEHDGSSP